MKARIYDLLRRMSGPSVRRWFKRQWWFVPVSRRLFGESVYSESYFADIERIEGRSVEVIAGWIVERLRPGRVVDIGCGPGHLMAALRERGAEVFGVDIAEAALSRSRAKGLSVERVDLTDAGQPIPGTPYDLAVCFEVAEHLDARFADALVRQLVSAAPVVMLTAAEPDASIGPGLFHVNEQPNAYWIERMTAAGMRLDEAATSEARRRFTAEGVIVYLAKPMVFQRTSAAGSPGVGKESKG